MGVPRAGGIPGSVALMATAADLPSVRVVAVVTDVVAEADAVADATPK